ncbi:class I SAM-dependent methyltransferase [Aestuariivivens insulae]|uniref:class I SAM-dependent methyltransferase n=1 Tax=Aestuariivivens insulae TaxID=1621988 RepID=UPI001F58077B|nr:class I SAM-dependent methyltransferase [Aestuariivivens insulae]
MDRLFLKKLKNPDRYRFEATSCYSCNGDDYSFFLKGEEDLTGKEGEFQFVKCNNCGLVYQNPRIALDQIKEFYDGEYIAHRKKKNWGLLTPLYEWTMNKHDRDKEKLVAKHVELNGQTEILDVGCAVGTFLLHIHQKYNVNISGVDFKEGLEYPDFNKIEFYEGLFYEQDIEENRYDAVTMWHFLEHCYDPNKSIQMAKKVLKKGGKLIVEVPRLDSITFKLFGRKWPGVQAPQHTVLYDKKSFISMMKKNGFKVTTYLPYGAFPPYFYVFAGSYFRIIGKNLNLNRIIFPYFLGQLILTPILWFQNYLNLAMQTVICEKIES